MFGLLTPDGILGLLLQSPAFQGALGALGIFLLKWFVGLVLDRVVPARKAAKAVADLVSFIKQKVVYAEKAGLLDAWTGDEKAVYVLGEVEKYLADKGIKGDANLVTLDWCRAQMEMIRAELFPSAPATVKK